MAPLRLLAYNATDGKFSLVYPSNFGGRVQYHIASYTWADSDEEEQAHEESDDDDEGDEEEQGQEGQHDQDDNDNSGGLIVGIEGVTWKPAISQKKLDGIKQFVRTSGVTYLWVDSLCIDQDNESEVNEEMGKMHDYVRQIRAVHLPFHLSQELSGASCSCATPDTPELGE